MIRCTRCGRILAKPAAKVETAAGVASYGPACAVRAGLVAAPMPRAVSVSRKRRGDSRQMALEVSPA